MRSVLLAVLVTALSATLAAGEQSLADRSAPACEAQLASGVPQSRLMLLARGFNISDWLDGPTRRRPDSSTLAALRARGFTHVRLPFGAERLMAGANAREGRRDLAELEFAVELLNRLGFAVTIDVHPGEAFARLHAAEPERAFRLLEPAWRQLARAFARHSPERLFFEVLNEPAVSWPVWNDQGPRFAAAIRREAPLHTIIYGYPDYQRIDALARLVPLVDANVVYAAHFYDPMIFTHQGLDWSEDPLRYLENFPFPARLTDPRVTSLIATLGRQGRFESIAQVKAALREPWTEERIGAAVDLAAACHRRPVMINEFGALSWKSGLADRVRWLQTVRNAAERSCIGWAHWDYSSGFGFVRRVGERESPDQTVLGALVDSKSK